jgi:hypothetical protein
MYELCFMSHLTPEQWTARVHVALTALAIAGAFGLYAIRRWHDSRDLRLGAAEIVKYAQSLNDDTLVYIAEENAFLSTVNTAYVAQCRVALANMLDIPLIRLRPYILVASVIMARKAFTETIRIAERQTRVGNEIADPGELDREIETLRHGRHELACAIESLEKGRHIRRDYVPAPIE